jgi:hypothetical protein
MKPSWGSLCQSFLLRARPSYCFASRRKALTNSDLQGSFATYLRLPLLKASKIYRNGRG